MIKRYMLVIGIVMFVAYVAHGREVGSIELSDPKLLNPRGELILDKRVWEMHLKTNPTIDLGCTGTDVVELPVFGECPDEPGYVEVGFPVCTQAFEVPKKLTVKEIAPGFIRLVCILDYENAVPIGEPDCDYSRCDYIEEPEWPFPGTFSQ